MLLAPITVSRFAAQTVFSGLAAYVRICSITSWSPEIRLRACVSGSGIACLLAHQRERHSGELVGACDGDELEGFGFQQLACAGAQWVIVLGLMNQHSMRTHDEQLAQILISHLGGLR
jgi:hypothetical protein